MYKPSITPEAAEDIVKYTLNNPFRKFEKATIEEFDIEGATKQLLTLHYSVEGVDYSQPGTQYSLLQMPIENVIEMLSFAMTSITSAHQLTEGYR